jgi:carbon-monoxide dehydrogenase medium subunit
MGLITHAMAYARPTSVDDAVDLLTRFPDTARVLAGGQSLIPLMKLELSQPEVLVDLGGIAELDTVRTGPGNTIEVGAMVTHNRLVTDPDIRERLPLLGETAALVADPQIRSLGTVGGALAHADPAGDYCMLAMALDAVILTNRREIPTKAFYDGPFTTTLGVGEVVTAARFPIARGPHSFVKLTFLPFDSGVPSVAVQRLGDGWRIGLTNVGHERSRARTVEEAIAGGVDPGEAARAAWTHEVDDTGNEAVPREYARRMAQVLTARALHLATAAGGR